MSKVQVDDPVRRIAIAAIAVMSLIAIGTCAMRSEPAPQPAEIDGSPAPTQAAPTLPSPAVVAKAVAALRTESGVVDVFYEPDNVVNWLVVMKDDGTDRMGRAETFCVQLAELGVPTEKAIVRIGDLKKLLRNREDERAADLGTVLCATGEVFGR